MSTAKHSKYEESANRKQVLSIRTSKNDDPVEWNKIIEWLKKEGGGTAKNGLYKLAKDKQVI
jgi:hypothetical protein